MGVVYCAEDLRLGRQVALKFVSEFLATDEQALMRLRSEARAASALNHPNICTIYDIGEEDGHPFIVMELMKGETLRDRLLHGPLKVAQVVELGVEIADALHAAHSEGIIHRDIKPGNIFITERGHAKVLDFGLAKLTPRLATSTTTDQPHTTAGVTHGTAAYMSPEQATGEVLDGRTDLFSLGVVLYECATGHHPFPGKTTAVIVAAILDRVPAPPLAWNPDLPVRLNEIINNCLEKDRELRYQSAADIRADLKRLKRDLDSSQVRRTDTVAGQLAPDASRTPASGQQRASDAGVRVESTPLSGAQPARSTSGFWWMVGTAAVAVVAITATLLLTRQDAPIAQPAGVVQPPPAAPVATPPPTERTIALAAASLNAGNYRAARTYAREVLAIEPNHSEAARIEKEATDAFARFDAAIADARQRLRAGDVTAAARALDQARTVDPASPLIVELTARLTEALRPRDVRAQPAASPPAARTEPPPAPGPTPPSRPADAPQETLTPAPRQPEPIAPIDTAPPRLTPALPPPVTAVPPPAVVETNKPAPPAPPQPDDDAMIREVIAMYGRAIERKDLALFRSIKPNLTPREEQRLDAAFRAVRSQRVTLTVVSITRKEDRASAVVRRSDVIDDGNGRQHTSQTQQVLTFNRTAAGWVIVEIR